MASQPEVAFLQNLPGSAGRKRRPVAKKVLKICAVLFLPPIDSLKVKATPTLSETPYTPNAHNQVISHSFNFLIFVPSTCC